MHHANPLGSLDCLPARWARGARVTLGMLAVMGGLAAGPALDAARADSSSAAPVEGDGAFSWTAPAGFDEMPIPADNPMSQEKIALGQQLYYDTRLSGDGKQSCYGCHVTEHGLTDGRVLAVGAFDKVLTRNAPTMWNVGYYPELYWDGRAKGLEAQVLGAWKGGNMGASDPTAVAAQLDKIKGYHDQFMKVFQTGVTVDGVQKAVAAYMRTFICGDTPFDRFQQGDKSAISDAAKRGWELFRGNAGCGTCHAGALFTDLQYHNVGIGMQAEKPDPGRFNVTKDEKDTGAFRTPTLRNIAKTAPYFHNGQAETLRQAIEIMAGGGIDNPHLDSKNLSMVELGDAEIDDLVAFLESLSCDAGGKSFAQPKLP